MIIMGKTGKRSLTTIYKGVAKIKENKMLMNQLIKNVSLNHNCSLISIISAFIK